MEEHVHILINLHSTVALADLVKAVKQSSSKWISEKNIFPYYEGWASEYYACSVSPAHVEAIKTYIDNQQEHHSHHNFNEERERFVTKMGLTLYKDID